MFSIKLHIMELESIHWFDITIWKKIKYQIIYNEYRKNLVIWPQWVNDNWSFLPRDSTLSLKNYTWESVVSCLKER